jgi:hypothetical protein
MPRKILIAGATALGLLAVVPAAPAHAAEPEHGAASGALRVAQAALEAPPPRRIVRTRPRIEVRPGRLLYRECVDGYREVWRPYWGTSVVMPYMRCWWVRR